jgi:hypothetical protein
MIRSLSALSLFVLVAVGCNSSSNGMATTAKEKFGKTYSCPLERVDVKERKDVDPAMLFNPPSKAGPPDEVKKDPARLAKWQADQKADWEKVASGYRRSYTVYEMNGCDHHLFFACTNADNAGQAGGTTVVCQERPLTAANPQ